MKTRSKKLLSAVLSLLLTLSVFAGFGPWVTHVSASPGDPTIHYFYDLPRLFTDAELTQQFPNYNITSTEVCLSESNVSTYIAEGLFAGIDAEDVVILEIKWNCPTVDFFDTLYSDVIGMLDDSVRVLLIMPFSLNLIEDGFTCAAYGITAYYQCNDDFLLFAQRMLADMLVRNGDGLHDARLLLDRWFIDSYQSVPLENWTFYGLIQHSGFLRAFFYAVDAQFNITDSPQPWYVVGDAEYYDQIKTELIDRRFQIYINYADNMYVPALLYPRAIIGSFEDVYEYGNNSQTWTNFGDLAAIGIDVTNAATQLFALITIPHYFPSLYNYIRQKCLEDAFDFDFEDPNAVIPFAVYGWVLVPNNMASFVITLWDLVPDYDGRLLEDWSDAMAFLISYIPIPE